jgi:hypothetical protein
VFNNVQRVYVLVMFHLGYVFDSHDEGPRHQLLVHWFIDWLVFNANFSSISALSWKCTYVLRLIVANVTIDETSLWAIYNLFSIKINIYLIKAKQNNNILNDNEVNVCIARKTNWSFLIIISDFVLLMESYKNY